MPLARLFQHFVNVAREGIAMVDGPVCPDIAFENGRAPLQSAA